MISEGLPTFIALGLICLYVVARNAQAIIRTPHEARFAIPGLLIFGTVLIVLSAMGLIAMTGGRYSTQAAALEMKAPEIRTGSPIKW